MLPSHAPKIVPVENVGTNANAKPLHSIAEVTIGS